MGLGYYYDAITNGKVVEDVEDGLHRDAKWKEAIKNIKADLDGVTLYECFNPNKAVENIIDKHTKELL